jgi:hypothetical protein
MKISRTVAVLFLLVMLSISAASAMEYSGPVNLEPQLSSDGKTMFNAVPAVVYRADPNPPKEQMRIPARFEMATLPETATSTFSITYAANGSTDPWSASCTSFPEEAKAAFNAAAAIWGNLLSSSVPITISACWSNLGSPSILGYSGGGHVYRNFTNAPRANTWYVSSLANGLAGSDLGPSYFDMYITYNSGFAWYYGTDGVTPAGQYDLMSVVLHEIAHGLNFSGSMSYSGGSGSWGSSTGYPNIYDTFMRDGAANPGNLLIDTGVYANPSTGLGSALTSNNIWFHGANAMAANGGQRVKMYAPSTWNGGSSYSHLDYATFAGTANRLMVYAISSGVSTHDPGPITSGIFKDMGWPSAATVVPTVTTAAVTGVTATTATGGGTVTSNGGATVAARGVCWSSSANPTTSDNCTNDGAGNGSFISSITGLSANTPYHVRAYATNSAGTAYGLEQDFTTTGGTILIINGGFESGLTGWATAQVSGTAGVWTAVSSGSYPSTIPHGGAMLARFNSYNASSGSQTRLYQTTGIAIPIFSTASSLSFWMSHDTGYSSYADQLQVQVSTDGSTWSNVGSPVMRYDETTGWSRVTLDLSAYKGQSDVRIGFLGTSYYGNDIYLDDVEFSATVPITSNVRIPGAGGYDLLQAAYDSAPSSCTIQSKAVALPASPFTLDLSKIILLEGGYDSSYSSNSGGYTTMTGSLTMETGSITLENLIIK